MPTCPVKTKEVLQRADRSVLSRLKSRFHQCVSQPFVNGVFYNEDASDLQTSATLFLQISSDRLITSSLKALHCFPM